MASAAASFRRDVVRTIARTSSTTGVAPDTLSADNVAFALAPRLNAAGRMSDPQVALDLLMTDDPARAEELSASLDELNRLRQAVKMGDIRFYPHNLVMELFLENGLLGLAALRPLPKPKAVWLQGLLLSIVVQWDTGATNDNDSSGTEGRAQRLVSCSA